MNVVLAPFAAASAGASFWQEWLVKKTREDAERSSEDLFWNARGWSSVLIEDARRLMFSVGEIEGL